MTTSHGDCQISDERERLDMVRVHQWLTNSYWSPGVTVDRVNKAMEHSALVLGAYCGDDQVGYMRLVSDFTTFAWIADVYVDDAHRGKGIGRAMVTMAREHPLFTDVGRWCLATRDAHEVYRALGFGPLKHPDHFMWIGQQPLPQ